MAAASAAFLCCCERKYRGVKAGEGGERRKGRSAEEDGREWGWEGRKERKWNRRMENEEDEDGGGRDAGKKKKRFKAGGNFHFHTGLLATHNVQGAAANLPRDWSGVKWVCTKGWLSTLLGLNLPRSRRGRELSSLLFTS